MGGGLERTPAPLSSGEVGSVASRERQSDGRHPDLRLSLFFLFPCRSHWLGWMGGSSSFSTRRCSPSLLTGYTDDQAALCRRRSRLCRTGTFSFSASAKRIFFSSFFEPNTKDSSSGSRSRGLKRFACAPMYSLQAGSVLFLLAVLAGLQVRLSPSGLPPDPSAACSSTGMFAELEARANWSPPSGHFERRAVNSSGVLHPRWVQTGL